MRTVHVLNTNTWLHRALTTGQQLDDWALVDNPELAELVLYPVPEWREEPAPDLHRFGLALRRGFFIYSVNDTPTPWAPGVYASLEAHRAGDGPFCGGFYIPHHAEEGGLQIQLVPQAEADLLWSFVGTVRTRPELRGRLIELADPRSHAVDTAAWDQRIRWTWSTTSQVEGESAFRRYAELLRRSKFVACPRGVGPGSMRVFETMQAGRCPVILSDDWMPPPFVDWDNCSLRLPESEVSALPALLRTREPEAAELGANARKAWEENFAKDRRLNHLAEACAQLKATQALGPGARVGLALRATASPGFASLLRRGGKRALAQLRRRS